MSDLDSSQRFEALLREIAEAPAVLVEPSTNTASARQVGL